MNWRSVLVVVSAGLLGGCLGDDMQDLKSYVAEVQSRPSGPIEPLPEIKPIETYVYVAANRRNPFSYSDMEDETPLAPTKASSGPQPDFDRRREELEQFPLDSLRMVGTLAKNEQTWGLIKTNDGTIYRVREGNYMGQNHGRIARIADDQIDLNELVPDGQGGYLERAAALALGEE